MVAHPYRSILPHVNWNVCEVFDCVYFLGVYRWRNIYALRCAGGDDGSCSLIYWFESHELHWNSYTTHYWFTIEGFVSLAFKCSEISLLVKTGCNTRSIFFPRSLSCLRTESADFWFLNWKARFIIRVCQLAKYSQIWFWS